MNVVHVTGIEEDAQGNKIIKCTNPEMLKKRVDTVPYDPRFPNTNQTKNCYQNYLDYFRCKKVKGEDYEPCYWYFFAYNQLCPNDWIEKWNEQREKGIFPGRI